MERRVFLKSIGLLAGASVLPKMAFASVKKCEEKIILYDRKTRFLRIKGGSKDNPITSDDIRKVVGSDNISTFGLGENIESLFVEDAVFDNSWVIR